jgi:hypothetical protein
MVVVLMLQAPDQRLHYRYLTRQLVYAGADRLPPPAVSLDEKPQAIPQKS